MNFLVMAIMMGVAAAEDGGDKKSEEKKEDSGPGWKVRPLIKPMVGTATYRIEGGEAVRGFRVGGQAGVRYTKKQKGAKKILPNLVGRTRVMYTTTLMSDAPITNINAGTFIGPQWGPLKMEVGADVLNTQYTGAGFGADYTALSTPASIGLKLKIPFVVGASLNLAAAPIFHMGDGRESVDWEAKDLPFFGDEFFYGAAAGIKVGPVGVGFSYQSRITAYGNDNTIGVGVGI
jgi:hypothetical protein